METGEPAAEGSRGPHVRQGGPAAEAGPPVRGHASALHNPRAPPPPGTLPGLARVERLAGHEGPELGERGLPGACEEGPSRPPSR